MKTTNKSTINALLKLAAMHPEEYADVYGVGAEDAASALEALNKSNNRPKVNKPRKPSVKTLALAEARKTIVAELAEREGEFTAADIADFTAAVTEDGITPNPRQVGSILRTACAEGTVAKSPEPWAVTHYAHPGYQFAPKPKREKKTAAEE